MNGAYLLPTSGTKASFVNEKDDDKRNNIEVLEK
jgi:hypothetical protein